jgi:hypothetical protein
LSRHKKTRLRNTTQRELSRLDTYNLLSFNVHAITVPCDRIFAPESYIRNAINPRINSISVLQPLSGLQLQRITVASAKINSDLAYKLSSSLHTSACDKMGSNTFKDNINEVTNSTDWLETPLKSLAAVEAALRCQICKEFYDTPLITSCEHTFCSLCIRRCLNQDGKCPVCRKDDQSSRLRHCKTLDELVQGFKLARPEVFTFATRPTAASPLLPPKRTRGSPKDSYQEEEPPNKRSRPSRTTRSRTAQNMVVLESDEEDGDFIPGKL